MQYAVLKPDGTFDYEVITAGNVLWDADNFCSAAALVRDGKAAQFRVVQLHETEPPPANPVTEMVVRDGGEFFNGRWQYRWRIDTLDPAQAGTNLESLKTRSVVQIDTEVDAIYLAALGNRGPEYTDAELAAQAYADAGYTGTVPADVQSWATAKGWTATQAADDILAAAVQLRTAKSAIRAARLLRKEQVRAAADGGQVTAAMVAWAGFAAAVRQQLGV